MKSTKYYSQLQESRLADYLGWEVVSGSGARDMHPGDIISENWLGECKTHANRSDKIKFNYAIWNKISKEAMSCLRKPAVFVDNGTQELENTWVMADKKFFSLHTLGLKKIVMSAMGRNNVTFKQAELQELLPYKCVLVVENFGKSAETIIITDMVTFKEIDCGELY